MRLIVKPFPLPLDKSIIPYRCHVKFQLNGNISWAGNEACRRRKTDQRLLLGERKSHVSSLAVPPSALDLPFSYNSVPRSAHVPRNSAVITVCPLNSRAPHLEDWRINGVARNVAGVICYVITCIKGTMIPGCLSYKNITQMQSRRYGKIWMLLKLLVKGVSSSCLLYLTARSFMGKTFY